MKASSLKSIAMLACASVLAVQSLPAVAGKPSKPGGGTGEDPCASAADFPAFVFTVVGQKSHTLYLADSTGKCVRKLQDGLAFRVAYFSYPVDGQANKGRVTWGGNPIWVQDFTVGAGNAISVATPRSVSDGWVMDLSRDGEFVYFSRDTSSIRRLRVADGSEELVFAATDAADWGVGSASVNGDGTQLFVARSGRGTNSGSSKLVRLDLVSDQEIVIAEWAAQSGYGANPFWPAADKWNDRVAFVDYIPNTNNCSPLVVMDYSGAVSFLGSRTGAVGLKPTWVGDKVVMDRREPANGRDYCRTTDSLEAVDLSTGGETILVSGGFADGR